MNDARDFIENIPDFFDSIIVDEFETGCEVDRILVAQH
jgi:hypothetical protein